MNQNPTPSSNSITAFPSPNKQKMAKQSLMPISDSQKGDEIPDVKQQLSSTSLTSISKDIDSILQSNMNDIQQALKACLNEKLKNLQN